MSSRSSKPPQSARKEFFGPGAPRSPKIFATDDPLEDVEPTSADQRPAKKRSGSKLLAELQPSSGWVQAGPTPPSKARASSVSRARDPADLNSDGPSRVVPTGSAPAAAVFSKAVSQMKKPLKSTPRSNSEANPGSSPQADPSRSATISPAVSKAAVLPPVKKPSKPVAAKAHSATLDKDASPFWYPGRPLNKDAPAFVYPGHRIPVHLAADCEWTDEQILAADDVRRAAALPGQFYSTGSASTHVPSYIPHAQANNVAAAQAPAEAAVESRDPESASSRSSSEVAPKKRKPSKKASKPKKQATKKVAIEDEADAEDLPKFDKRPRVLWTNEAPKKPQLGPRPTNVTFKNFRKCRPDLDVPVKPQDPSAMEERIRR